MTEPVMTSEPLESEGPASETEVGAILLPPEGQPGSLSAMAQQPAAEAAASNPVLTTLSTAVEAADLVDTLNGEGPFTIFAPIDDAFAAVPQADLDALLADPEALADVLTYHVVRGEALSTADLSDRTEVEVVNGGTVTLAPEGETVELNDGQAGVILSDIPVANGVVHLIDGVLMEQ